MGSTLTSSGLSPPEVQMRCGGAAVCAWGVEKLDKIGLLEPTAKGLFLGVGCGCTFWEGARVSPGDSFGARPPPGGALCGGGAAVCPRPSPGPVWPAPSRSVRAG